MFPALALNNSFNKTLGDTIFAGEFNKRAPPWLIGLQNKDDLFLSQFGFGMGRPFSISSAITCQFTLFCCYLTIPLRSRPFKILDMIVSCIPILMMHNRQGARRISKKYFCHQTVDIAMDWLASLIRKIHKRIALFMLTPFQNIGEAPYFAQVTHLIAPFKFGDGAPFFHVSIIPYLTKGYKEGLL